MHTTSYPIVLERKQPQRNMARFYLLELDRDLFGIALARRSWGRIGTVGRSIEVPFPSADAAPHELDRLQDAKRRRGHIDRLT